MVHILLIDDHEIVRSGLKTLIKSILPHAVIDEAQDGDTGLKKIKETRYQLVILDIRIPGTDSVGLMDNIRQVRPETAILIFSMNAEELYAKRYLQLGARGYITKSASFSDITDAITSVLNNKRYISPALRTSFLDQLVEKKKEADNPFDSLSPREFEIVQHLLMGESSVVISEKLSLGSSTVATHKARIFKKLQCKNIVELSVFAKIHGIATPSL